MSAPDLFSHRPYWAKRLGVAPFLPRSRTEMEDLGWEACDVILVTGDAYVDHPSFGMALIGRLLEAHGFRVGVLDQPNWRSKDAFLELGAPTLFWGVTGGNMDSLVNHYTSDKKPRRDDAYTPGGLAGQRPDRASLVYTQRCREAHPDVPVIIGGIEASLRRLAHYDYWSGKVRRSLLVDSGADLLVYGNAERAIVDVAHRLARGESIREIRDVRGTVFRRRIDGGDESDTALADFVFEDSSRVDTPGRVEPLPNPYASEEERRGASLPEQVAPGEQLVSLRRKTASQSGQRHPRERTALILPSWEAVRSDPVLYAHASRVFHLESNPHNARCLVQRNGDFDVWANPPPVPLTTQEMDRIYELPYQRVPHPAHGSKLIPAYDMIRFSVTIMRGCFGGCSFCSITEHEGRIIQNRSENSILREVERLKEIPGFTGAVSDLGGPTANMYRLACKSREIEAKCRRPSCVYPGICKNLNTDHSSLISLYRKARALPGIKKISIASGLRYDLAVEHPEYVKELVTHHVGGYLKIAPEHVAEGPLSKMMKPGVGTYDRFKEMFEEFSRRAGKKQYLIPYFIAAHPGTSDEDMLELALWLKHNRYRADQVQAFLPSPMSSATAMYHSERNPLRPVRRDSELVATPKSQQQRTLHKAFLRYHDPKGWPLLRAALRRMGRDDLIGSSPKHLVPYETAQERTERGGAQKRGRFATQHTGLPRFSPPTPSSSKRKPRS